MFQILLAEPVSAAGMFLFFMLSMGILLFLTIRYDQLIRDAENMSITQRKELKAMKTKFLNSYGAEKTEEDNRYARKEQINVEVFVDKAISRFTFRGLNVKSWRFFAGQTLFMSTLFAGFGAFNSLIKGSSLHEISPFYLIVFLELYVYFSVLSICDFEGKEKLLRLTILEYMENHMLNRIQVAEAFLAEENVPRTLETEQKKEEPFSEEEEKELDELLQEFFV